MNQTACKEWQRFNANLDPIEAASQVDLFGGGILHRYRDAGGDTGSQPLSWNPEFQDESPDLNPANDDVEMRFATAVHDMQNPLSVACNAAMALKDPHCPAGERQQWLNCVLRNLTALQFVVEDFNDRFCHLPTEPRREVFDLALLAHEVVKDCASVVKTHRFRFEGTEGHIAGDRERIRRLLFNLVANAVKYSEIGKVVAVEVWERDGYVCLDVHDQGRGVSVAETERIFLPYTRLTPETSHGSGLGLTSVKRIADAHEAKVFVQGVPGEGSTFEVRFGAANPEKQETEGESCLFVPLALSGDSAFKLATEK